MTRSLVTVGSDLAGCAGALVFWSLSGLVVHDDMVEVCEGAGLAAELHPRLPSAEVCASRAIERALDRDRKGEKYLVRPLSKRGCWDVVHELKSKDAAGKERLVHTPVLRVEVDHTTVDGEDCATLRTDFLVEGEATTQLEARIRQLFTDYEGILFAEDVGGWLTSLLRSPHLDASPMRERGGFYFVPRDRVPAWRAIVAAVRSVSSHQLFEIPALQSDEAVAAILASVKREADEAMKELETYLAGERSTKGLNAWERDLKALQAKVERYQTLLGVELPDFTTKAQVLLGAVVAARITPAERPPPVAGRKVMVIP